MQYINSKTNQITELSDIIIVNADGSRTYNITKETALANGWTPFNTETTIKAMAFTTRTVQASRTLDNEEALEMQDFLSEWADHVGGKLEQGQTVRHNGHVYRVRQEIGTVLENQAPSLDTSALYEIIEREHAGTLDDPKPYTPPMEVLKGMYYVQDGITYVCTRDSGTALTHNLAELVGIYVELAEETGGGRIEKASGFHMAILQDAPC